MTEEPRFRTDLYRGTASDYDRFRPPYPDQLLDDLRARADVGDGGRMLDLACGTGQLAFALAGDFDEVWAVDQEGESVAFGRTKAEALGVGNITWVAGRAEDVSVPGSFDLVTIGNAFHRVRREVVAARALTWLAPGRGLALVWSGTPCQGEGRWEVEMAAALGEWMHRVGAADRIPAGIDETLADDPHPQVLERVGLAYVGKFEFAVDQVWTVETLTGFVYSTSSLNRHALGEHVDAFEADLAARLLACEPTGEFPHTMGFAYELARRPG